jgi:putative transposase
MILPQVLLEGGLKTIKSDASDQIRKAYVEEKGCTIRKTSIKSLVRKKKALTKELPCVMPESVQITKKKTSKGKSKSSVKPIQIPKSSKILVQGLTGKDKVLEPFWKESVKEMSRKLWLPTRTECVDLDMNSLNGFYKKTIQNSWFSTRVLTSKTSLGNSQMTYLQSLQSLLPKTTDSGQLNTKETEKNLKVIKIQIYPSKYQRKTLKEWYGVQRFIYNRCLYEIRVNKVSPNLKDLREKVVMNKNYISENKWMLDYNFDLRDEALRDLLFNYKSNFEKSKKTKKAFKIQYKKKKNLSESLSVLGKYWNKTKRCFFSSIFTSNMKSSEELPKKLQCTSRLVHYPSLKTYFLHLPITNSEMHDESQVKKILSLDPGVKTFLTGYDPSGKILMFGTRDIGRIARLIHYKNKLKSMIDKGERHKKTKSVAILRINNKIWNLVEEMHKKLAKWICENYTEIHLPKLNFHNCKKLDRKSTSKLSSLRHCGFFNKLLHKSKSYPGCRVVQVNESYTSMTCTNCGNLHSNLKNKDIYNCNVCNISIERDINASRNIFMRFFTKELGLE